MAKTAAAEATEFDYRAIENAIRAGQLSLAEYTLAAHLKTAPDDARARILAGIVLSKTKNSEAAKAQFRRAAELAPRTAAPYVNLGDFAASQGDLGEAISEFQSALSFEPHNLAALSNLGLLLLTQRNFQQAASELEKAVELSPDDVEIRLALFEAQCGSRRFAQAHKTASDLTRAASSLARMLQTVGTLQVQFGDYSEAVINLKRTVELNPQSYEAAYNLALAYDATGDAANSARVLSALNSRSSNPELLNLLGSIYEKNLQPLDAIKMLKQAATAEPLNESYRFDYICELVDHGNFGAAKLVASPAASDFPRSLRIRLALGISFVGLGDYAAANQLFVTLAEEFKDSSLPLQILTFAPDLGDVEAPQLMSLIEAYSRRHPGQFPPNYFLGHIAARNGNLPRAIAYFEESLRADPKQARARYELGLAYANTGNQGAAIQQFLAVLKVNPQMVEAQYHLFLAYRKSGASDQAKYAEKQFRHLQATDRSEVIHRFLYSMR